jgi:hypothetical protein
LNNKKKRKKGNMNLIECDICGGWDAVADQELESIFELLGFGNFVCYFCTIKAMAKKGE